MSAWWLALLLFLAPTDLQQAEASYRAGRYQEAMVEFQAALAEPGAAAGPILYDLGNCAYRLGRHAEAVLYYRRALLRLRRDPELRFNLRLAEQKLGMDVPATESFGAAVVGLVDAFGRGELLALAVTLQTVGLLGAVLLRRRRGLRLLPWAVTLLGVLAGARLARDTWFAPAPEGVVVSDEISLRSEPRADLAVTLKLKAGELVRVEEQSDRWVRVVHPQGRGWTERAGVGVVE